MNIEKYQILNNLKYKEENINEFTRLLNPLSSKKTMYYYSYFNPSIIKYKDIFIIVFRTLESFNIILPTNFQTKTKYEPMGNFIWGKWTNKYSNVYTKTTLYFSDDLYNFKFKGNVGCGSDMRLHIHNNNIYMSNYDYDYYLMNITDIIDDLIQFPEKIYNEDICSKYKKYDLNKISPEGRNMSLFQINDDSFDVLDWFYKDGLKIINVKFDDYECKYAEQSILHLCTFKTPIIFSIW